MRGLLLCLVLVAACGGSTETETEGGSEGTTGGESSGTGAGGGSTGGPSPDVIEGRIIPVAPGFVPDPRVVQGQTEADQLAQGLNEGCVGYIGAEPDHTLVLQGAFTMLAVMASSPQDVTLVIQGPDGAFYCNDDYEGTNPYTRLDGPGAGTYNVFVGSYEQDGAGTPYHLGVTTLGTVMPSMLSPGEEPADIDLGEDEPIPAPQPAPAPTGNVPPPSARSP